MPDPDPTPPDLRATALLHKAAVWGGALAALYLFRDFFLAAFLTFLFSYTILGAVGWGMRRLSPGRDRPRLRRLLTVGVFVLTPAALVGVGLLVGPSLLDQGRRMAGWLGRVSPEGEVARLVGRYVGPSEFADHYGGPGDPRYDAGLAEFQATGERHVRAYLDFPQLEAWVESGFAKPFADAERGRVRARLAREGTSSREFEQWFRAEKVPELQREARVRVPEKGRPADAVPPLVRAAAAATPDQLLDLARTDARTLAALQREWTDDSADRAVEAARGSPAYLARLRGFYDQHRRQAPQAIPYTFDEYRALQVARPRGEKAFGDALEAIAPTPPADAAARLRADFEAARQNALFQQWWGTSPTARFLRRHLESAAGGVDPAECALDSLLNVPADVGTALLLSLFICIDFPRLRRGFQSLRETWLRGVYDEVTPAFAALGRLVGRAMLAQGVIALGNAVLVFVGLELIGVDHPVLLAGATFVLCLVPTLGTLLSLALITVVALAQPGGGLGLALMAAAVVLVVIAVENFVTGPLVLGRMMNLHPVVSIGVLPLAQYFFGVWGLILATPVAVYVVHEVILRHGVPGGTKPAADRTAV